MNINAINNAKSVIQTPGALDPKAVKAAKDFESVLLNKLMEEMQTTIPDSGLFEDNGTKQVQGIFWHYLSQDVADKGGTGLWKDLYRQMASHDKLAGMDTLDAGLPNSGLDPDVPSHVEVLE